MDFSIVIPVRNRPEAIRAAVASCVAQGYPAERYEVIVVDNGSTDATAREAASAGARVVSEARPNRCLARNLGASEARGRWIVCTDSDCEAEPGWLEAFANAERALNEEPGSARFGALAGAVVPGPARTAVEAYIAARGWIDQEKFLREGNRFSPPFAATANLAIRREAWTEVGGFDPDLSRAGEDADWCWRAAAAGWGIQYVPGAHVAHHHRASVREMVRQAYGYGLGNADLFAKWRGKWGAQSWLEPRRLAWAAKGLLKTPWLMLAARTPAERYFGYYDFLSNAAQAWGRWKGGRQRGVWMI